MRFGSLPKTEGSSGRAVFRKVPEQAEDRRQKKTFGDRQHFDRLSSADHGDEVRLLRDRTSYSSQGPLSVCLIKV